MNQRKVSIRQEKRPARGVKAGVGRGTAESPCPVQEVGSFYFIFSFSRSSLTCICHLPISKTSKSVIFDRTTLFLASAALGDLEEVEKYIKEGVDVNGANSEGLTALHVPFPPSLSFHLPRHTLIF